MIKRIAAAIVWMCACHGRAEELGRPATTVDDGVVMAADEQVAAIGMLGVVVPRHEVRLSTDSVARVREIPVSTGERVEAGAVVVRLDDRGERSELRSALASVRAAQADARRLELDAQHSAAEADRAERIAAHLSEDELLELRHARKSLALGSRRAGADAAERQARADHIEQRIAGAVIESPFAGVVVERLADPGAIVVAGEPLVHIISTELQVRFAAHEEDLDALRVGAAVRIVFPELGLEVATCVQSVAPEIDAATRIVMIEAPLELDAARSARVRAGAIARVHAGTGANLRAKCPVDTSVRSP